MDGSARRRSQEAADEAAGATLVLERFLPYRLSVLANRVSRGLACHYQRRHRLSVPQWRVLAVLAHSAGLSASEVAAKTEMDKVRVSRAVASLIAQGRVVRRLADDDRRRSTLRLSAKGQEIYRAVAPVALDYERRLLSTLTAADRAALDRLLEALSAQTGR